MYAAVSQKGSIRIQSKDPDRTKDLQLLLKLVRFDPKRVSKIRFSGSYFSIIAWKGFKRPKSVPAVGGAESLL